MISLVVAIVVVEVLVMGGVPFRAALAKVRTGKQQLTMPIEEVPIGTHGVGHELTNRVMGKTATKETLTKFTTGRATIEGGPYRYACFWAILIESSKGDRQYNKQNS